MDRRFLRLGDDTTTTLDFGSGGGTSPSAMDAGSLNFGDGSTGSSGSAPLNFGSGSGSSGSSSGGLTDAQTAALTSLGTAAVGAGTQFGLRALGQPTVAVPKPVAAPSGLFGMSSGTLLLLAAAAGGLFLLTRKKG